MPNCAMNATKTENSMEESVLQNATSSTSMMPIAMIAVPASRTTHSSMVDALQTVQNIRVPSLPTLKKPAVVWPTITLLIMPVNSTAEQSAHKQPETSMNVLAFVIDYTPGMGIGVSLIAIKSTA